mmetsp:Transcript_48587/g.96891  ORF Transcript_48587/g.96891 Transcript_48587/m.96891 type:complete len:212 (+) Transcript_48587:1110-1745(+)
MLPSWRSAISAGVTLPSRCPLAPRRRMARSGRRRRLSQRVPRTSRCSTTSCLQWAATFCASACCPLAAATLPWQQSCWTPQARTLPFDATCSQQRRSESAMRSCATRSLPARTSIAATSLVAPHLIPSCHRRLQPFATQQCRHGCRDHQQGGTRRRLMWHQMRGRRSSRQQSASRCSRSSQRPFQMSRWQHQLLARQQPRSAQGLQHLQTG